MKSALTTLLLLLAITFTQAQQSTVLEPIDVFEKNIFTPTSGSSVSASRILPSIRYWADKTVINKREYLVISNKCFFHLLNNNWVIIVKEYIHKTPKSQ